MYNIIRKDGINMYIQPNSTIKILENIPLNKSYEHTVYYDDKDKQYEAFNKYTKYTLTNYSYQRVSLGTIRLDMKYEDVYMCNYVMFKNTSYEDKWFYAFIIGVDYVNDNVTYLHYDIDVMQTWCYDYNFRGTFVERQHATSDIPYENTQPEGLELGTNYVYQGNSISFPLIGSGADKSFIILATTTSSGSHPSPSVVNGALFSLAVYRCSSESTAIDTVKQFINNGYEDNIVSIYTVPTSAQANQSKNITRPKTLDGYTPRNKKLYSYPYTFIEMYNNTGENLELKYENFVDDNGNKINSLDYSMKFQCLSYDIPTPQAKLLPFNYLMTGASLLYNTVTYSQFPTGAFSGDSFKVWLAQNRNSYGASLNAIGNTFDTNVQIAQNNWTMAGISASNSRTNDHLNYMSNMAQAENTNQSALAIMEANYNKQYFSDSVNLVKNIGQGAQAGAQTGDPKAVALGAIAGGFIGYANMSYNQDIYNAQQGMANTQLLNAQIAGGTSESISVNNIQTAQKMADYNQTNANLSALNTYQNAINALVAKKQDAQHQPSNLHGAMMNDVWNGALGLVGFTVSCRSIKREYAEVIDNYFDRYGYAQRRMYVPQRINRAHWSYLKTCGCNITGHMNNSDLMTIKGIYDNGITTWHSLEEVGNYTLDNTIK